MPLLFFYNPFLSTSNFPLPRVIRNRTIFTFYTFLTTHKLVNKSFPKAKKHSQMRQSNAQVVKKNCSKTPCFLSISVQKVFIFANFLPISVDFSPDLALTCAFDRAKTPLLAQKPKSPPKTHPKTPQNNHNSPKFSKFLLELPKNLKCEIALFAGFNSQVQLSQILFC